MWRESLHCTLVWMILQTKHEITSIHLNDQLHWLYLASSNNLPLLLPALFSSPRSPSSLSIAQTWSFTPLSLSLSLFLFSYFPHRPTRSPVYCTYNVCPSSKSFLSFRLRSSSLNFCFPRLYSLSPLWCLFCCLVFFSLVSVAHGNPRVSLRIRAYWLGLRDRKVDDKWWRGTANANGDL